jgi:serine/threonine protein kinase
MTSTSETAPFSPIDIGRYTLRERAGAGSFGTVYRATDNKTGEVVAVKRLAASALGNTLEDARRRFEKEKVIFEIPHPHIVAGIEHFEWMDPRWNETEFVLVMEWLEGADLKEFLDRQERLPCEVALGVFSQCASALALAAEKGVIHRDIKPANIFLLKDGAAKIIDFGVGRVASSTGGKTATGLPGTVEYLAPDLARTGCQGDERSDIFSFGVCLYEALTGTHPFPLTGRSDQERMMGYFGWAQDYHESEIDFLDEVFVSTPQLREFLLRCLSALPEDRWGGFAAVGEQLADLLARQSGSGSPTGGEGTDTGTPVLGGYRLIERLSAHGGFARLWLAEAPGSAGGTVALKILREQFGDEESIENFRREAKVLRLLSGCPYIAQFIDHLTAMDSYGHEQHCIVLEYISGSNLRELLDERPDGLDPEHLLRVFRCVAIGLQYAHSLPKPVIHRDLKPANVVCMDEGGAKLIDFGIAHEEGGSRLTAGDVKGTWDYIAPEFGTRKGFHGDPTSDLFSFGVCLHEAVTGHLPYPKLEGPDVSVMHAFFDRLGKLDPASVDWSHPTYEQYPRLRELVACCIEGNPEKRPADLIEVIRLLDLLAVSEGLLPDLGGHMAERVTTLLESRLDLEGRVLLPTGLARDADGVETVVFPDPTEVGRPISQVVTAVFGAEKPQAVVVYLVEILQCVALMHSRSLWHGDLTGETILVADGRCVLGHPLLGHEPPADVGEALADDLRAVAHTLFVCTCSGHMAEHLYVHCRKLSIPDAEAYLPPPFVQQPCAITLVPELSRLLTYLSQGALGASEALQRARALLSRPRCGCLIGANRMLGAAPAGYDAAKVPQDKWYEYLQELDSGGCGIVWVVRRLSDGTKLALKSAREEFSETRFEDEIQALQSFSHPNIVSYVDNFHEHDMEVGADRSYLVMELLVGSSLRALIQGRNDGKCEYTSRDVVGYFDGYLAALQHCHEHKVIHRDLKPANLYVTRDGSPKLLDFGVARNTRGTQQTAGTIPGTLEYMAPEFAAPKQYGIKAKPKSGDDEAESGFRGDELSDLFAVGLCLYEALTGQAAYGERLPRPKEGLKPLYFAFRDRSLRIAGRTDAWFKPYGMPRSWIQLFSRALSPVRGQRFPNADAFRNELAKLADEIYVPPGRSKTGGVEPPPPPPPRPWKRLLYAAILCISLTLGALFFGPKELWSLKTQYDVLHDVPSEVDAAESLTDLEKVIKGLEEIRPAEDAWELRRQSFAVGFDAATGQICQALEERIIGEAGSAATLAEIASFIDSHPRVVGQRKQALLTGLRDRIAKILGEAGSVATLTEIASFIDSHPRVVGQRKQALLTGLRDRIAKIQGQSDKVDDLEQAWAVLRDLKEKVNVTVPAKANLALRHELIEKDCTSGQTFDTAEKLKVVLDQLKLFKEQCKAEVCPEDEDVAEWRKEMGKLDNQIRIDNRQLLAVLAKDSALGIVRSCRDVMLYGAQDWEKWKEGVLAGLEGLAGFQDSAELSQDRSEKSGNEAPEEPEEAGDLWRKQLAEDFLRKQLAEGGALLFCLEKLHRDLCDNFGVVSFGKDDCQKYQVLVRVYDALTNATEVPCPGLEPFINAFRTDFEKDKNVTEILISLGEMAKKHDFENLVFEQLSDDKDSGSASLRKVIWPGSEQEREYDKLRKVYGEDKKAENAWDAIAIGFAGWEACPTVVQAGGQGQLEAVGKDAIETLADANPYAEANPYAKANPDAKGNPYAEGNPYNGALGFVRDTSTRISGLKDLDTVAAHHKALLELHKIYTKAVEVVQGDIKGQETLEKWAVTIAKLEGCLSSKKPSLDDLTDLGKDYAPFKTALESAWGKELTELTKLTELTAMGDASDKVAWDGIQQLPSIPDKVRQGDLWTSLATKATRSVTTQLAKLDPVDGRADRLGRLEEEISNIKVRDLLSKSQTESIAAALTEQEALSAVEIPGFHSEHWSLRLKGEGNLDVTGSKKFVSLPPSALGIDYFWKARTDRGRDSNGTLSVSKGGGIICPGPPELAPPPPNSRVHVEWQWAEGIPRPHELAYVKAKKQGQEEWEEVGAEFQAIRGETLYLSLELPGYKAHRWQVVVNVDAGVDRFVVSVPMPDTLLSRVVEITVVGEQQPSRIRYAAAPADAAQASEVENPKTPPLAPGRYETPPLAPGSYEFFLFYGEEAESQHRLEVEVPRGEGPHTISLTSSPPVTDIGPCMKALDRVFSYLPDNNTGTPLAPVRPVVLLPGAYPQFAALLPGNRALKAALKVSRTRAEVADALRVAAGNVPDGGEVRYLLYASAVFTWTGGKTTVAACAENFPGGMKDRMREFPPLLRFVEYASFGGILFDPRPDDTEYKRTKKFFADWRLWCAKTPSFSVTPEDTKMEEYVTGGFLKKHKKKQGN